jgi:hypothetical protein
MLISPLVVVSVGAPSALGVPSALAIESNRSAPLNAIGPSKVFWLLVTYSVALEFEFVADEVVEIHSRDEDIAAQDFRSDTEDLEGGAEIFENLLREEGDLPLVVRLVVEVTVASKTLALDTLHFLDFLDRGFPGRPPMVTDEVVFFRDVEVANLHGTVPCNRLLRSWAIQRFWLNWL